MLRKNIRNIQGKVRIIVFRGRTKFLSVFHFFNFVYKNINFNKNSQFSHDYIKNYLKE